MAENPNSEESNFSGIMVPGSLVLCSETSFCSGCSTDLPLATAIPRCRECRIKLRYGVVLADGGLSLWEGAVACSRQTPLLTFLGSVREQTIGARQVYCRVEPWMGFEGSVIKNALLLCGEVSFCSNCHAYARPDSSEECYRCHARLIYAVVLEDGVLSLTKGAEAAERRDPRLEFLGSVQGERRVYRLKERWCRAE